MVEPPRSPSKMTPTPNLPLLPLSPERASARDNTSPQHSRHIPQSPSLPNFDAKYDARRANLDVQGMVAKFNHLDIKDHAELRKRDKAALERAQMGREEAEGELKRLREETRKMKKDMDDGADRERKMVKRLDAVTDDLNRTKETSAHAQQLYEKEIRRARKEAFKASSTLVKLQEELKAARATLNVVKTDLDTERHKTGRREQEAFKAQYELVSVQQELSNSKERVKVVEEERDALKTSLKEEEVARVAAEGMIALPPSSVKRDGEVDEFGSPRKHHVSLATTSRPMTPTSRPQQTPAQHKTDLDSLQAELAAQTEARRAAELHIDFMRMECQFQCCSCRVAERKGMAFVHDASFETEIQSIRPAVTEIDMPPAYEEMQVDRRDATAAAPPHQEKRALQPLDNDTSSAQAEEPIFSPESGTFRSVSGSSTVVNAGNNSGESPERMDDEPSILRALGPAVVIGRPSIHRLKDGREQHHDNPYQPPNHPLENYDAEAEVDDTKTPTTSIPPTSPPLLSPASSAHPESDAASEPDTYDDEDYPDDDIFLQSPTTRIAATTSTVRIPLAPLSSPARPPPPASLPSPPTDTDNKENAAPATPKPLPSGPSTFATPGPAPADADADAHAHAWQTPLTRAEAIEKLRERRGRARADTATAAAETAPATTPKRAASHGQPLKTPGAEGRGAARDAASARRDVSAPARTPRTVGR